MLSHRFVDVAVTGLAARLAVSLAVLPIALMLLGQAPVALWKNEARASFADEASRAIPFDPARADKLQGQLVAVSGTLRAHHPAGDPELLEPGPWLGVIRQVETWGWDERVETETERLWGGALRTTTVWTYVEARVPRLLPPDEMRHPEGHENPSPRFESAAFIGGDASLEGLRVDPALLAGIAPVPLDPRTLSLRGAAVGAPIVDGAVFIGEGTPDDPAPGDQWIRFLAVPDGLQITAFGEVIGDTLREHPWRAGLNLLFAFEGDRQTAVDTLRGIDTLLLWAVRAAGVGALWLGLFLLLSPLFILLDILPPLGMLGRVLAGIVLVVPAAATGIGIIIVSQTVHSTPALLLLGAFAAYVAWATWRLRRDRQRLGVPR